MKTNKNISSQINKDKNTSEISSEELVEIFRKYHSQEHYLFDMVDDKYKNRLSSLLGVEVV